MGGMRRKEIKANKQQSINSVINGREVSACMAEVFLRTMRLSP